MAVLRNAGLRPYLDPGVQRSYTYDFVESYADNWWCDDWTNPLAEQHGMTIPASVAFLPAASRATAEKEILEFRDLGSADEYLGSQVVAYATSHPNDPDVPEALYLTLRMIRYSCIHSYSSNPADAHTAAPGKIAQQVVALMRRRYIANPWTKKAAPFVYLGDRNTSTN
jgi:hypothetical protein